MKKYLILDGLFLGAVWKYFHFSININSFILCIIFYINKKYLAAQGAEFCSGIVTFVNESGSMQDHSNDGFYKGYLFIFLYSIISTFTIYAIFILFIFYVFFLLHTHNAITSSRVVYCTKISSYHYFITKIIFK